MAEAAVTEEAHCRLSCGTWASESSGQWDYGPISNQAEAATWRERGRERGAMERQVCPCVATGWHTEEPRGGLQGRQVRWPQHAHGGWNDKEGELVAFPFSCDEETK